jgi:hypothetical protein
MTQGAQSSRSNVKKSLNMLKYANVFSKMMITATTIIYHAISFQFGD